MSSAVRSAYYVSPQDYLAGERIGELKHEYLAGALSLDLIYERTHL